MPLDEDRYLQYQRGQWQAGDLAEMVEKSKTGCGLLAGAKVPTE